MTLPTRTDTVCEVPTCERTLKPHAVLHGHKKCWACWYQEKKDFYGRLRQKQEGESNAI